MARAQVTTPAGRKVDQSRVWRCDSAEIAAKKLAVWRDDLTGQQRLPGVVEAPAFGVSTLGAFAREWYAARAPLLDPGTVRYERDVLRLHVLPALGELDVRAISQMRVQQWVGEQIQAGAAPSTTRRRFRFLRTLLRDVIAHLGLYYDPTMRIRLPADSGILSPCRRPLQAQEIAALLTAVRMLHFADYGLVSALAYTGLRFSHVAGWHWGDITEDSIGIVRKATSGAAGKLSRVKRAPPRLPISPALRAVLQLQRDLQHESPRQRLAADTLVFPSRAGNYRRYSSLRPILREACESIGIAPITVHSFRRSFADLARQSGVDPVVQRALIGHTTDGSRQLYSTVSLTEMRAASDLVAGKISAFSATRK